MTALAADNDTIKGPLAGEQPVDSFVILNAEIVYAGGLLAMDYTKEVQMASDTLGLRVLGLAPDQVDNTADGKSSAVLNGIFRLNNSATYPLTRQQIGEPCYVEDDNTVASESTNRVPAGLVVDVDSDGVWVNLTQQALAKARRLARVVVVAVTGTTATLTAAQCFQGNVLVTADNGSGVVLTLPTAQPGYRLAVQRISATAAHDVSIKAPTGDTILGSAAAKQVDNTVDAVSDLLWIETIDATAWVVATPRALDYASWAINNA